MFAGVVTFASADEKHTEWKRDNAIFDSLPKLLINFATKSRADSGFRLLKRCIRHALDSQCPSLEGKTATLIKHGDDIGLRIHSDVPASMKKEVVYKSGIAFTENDVLCCKCTCHCGSQDKERIVCVHNFPLVFLLMLLLMDALAESILMELAACLRSNISDFVRVGKDFFHATPVTETKETRRKADEPPIVQPGKMSDGEVKRRTGMPSEIFFLSIIIMVCNGDINTILQRQTSLTWYEEWLITFEYVWNRSLTRFQDLSKAFDDVRDEDLRQILDAKFDIIWNARNSWPMFASFEEDKALQKEKWASRYDGLRPVMWDMTNVSAYAFSNADWQRLTYSSYYNENCFKAGVFCQPCGWMGVTDLWTGGVSDSDFNRRAGYLEKQQLFQEKDRVVVAGENESKVVPFLNIYDKGYRAKMAAWQHGRQLVLQPDFKDSDKRFNRNQTISSASVASDRGGNERVVNVSKRAGLISRGFPSEYRSDPLQ